MAYFSPDLATYIDATLGWDLDSYDALQGRFRAVHAELGAAGAGRTPRAILANETSALVHMVDTPGALRRRAAGPRPAIDLADGKIVRWVRDDQVATRAAPELTAATVALHRALGVGGAGSRARRTSVASPTWRRTVAVAPCATSSGARPTRDDEFSPRQESKLHGNEAEVPRRVRRDPAQESGHRWLDVRRVAAIGASSSAPAAW